MDVRSRAHFAAVSKAMADEAVRRRKELMSGTPLERILEGLRLGYAMPTDEATETELDRRALAQAELHRVARERTARDGGE